LTTRPPAPLSLKPDLAEAARRWEAHYAGEIIDRPVLWATAPRDGRPPAPRPDYAAMVRDDIDGLVERILASAEALHWCGEAIPHFFLSFGPDEVAAFCGGSLSWSDDSPGTNWSTPFVDDWEQALPLRLDDDHPLWQRLLELYRRAARRLAGKMLLTPPDLHTNMDLLAAARGPQRLCLDVVERPDLIDEAMASARQVFRDLWPAVVRAGRMDELGYCHAAYSMDGAAVLQCDFSCMISPAMARRWVLPALEEEASIVNHAVYHWDGPEALVHADDLFATRGLQALSYVPGAGHGSHIDHLDLLKRIQAGGKVAHAHGTAEEIQAMHRELRPDRVVYYTHVASPAEADRLAAWLVRNT